MDYKYYPLEQTSVDELKDFFADLFGWRPDFSVQVLKNEEYDRLHTQKESACLVTIVKMGDPNSKNLLSRSNAVVRVIKIRLHIQGVGVAVLMHEMLHMYYPQVKEATVEQAETTFEVAFLCYDALYNSQTRRDFFVQLCKDGSRLIKWAGLPEFDLSKIQSYENGLLAKNQNNQKIQNKDSI